MARDADPSNGKSPPKTALIFASIAIGLLIPLATAELMLRFLPVAESLKAMPVNASTPVFHFTPNRSLTWSLGWNFSVVNRLHINDAGYVNDRDYGNSDGRPVFAVIGDSYVEAAMVPYAETLQGRLAQRAGPDKRVYSFGASGAALSQYLIWAREARLRFKAQALAIVVVGNDFDESLAAYKLGSGFHHYVADGTGKLTLQRFDFEPGLLRDVVDHSALLRYLVFNLHAHDHLRQLWDKLSNLVPSAQADEFVGNTPAEADRLRVDRSKAAIRAFLHDLVAFAGWAPGKVVFVVDGIRYPTTKKGVLNSYFVQMRTYFMEEAQAAGFEVIDMDVHFFTRDSGGEKIFEFEGDAHWNGLAHGIAADAVAASGVFQAWQQGDGR